MPNEAVPYSGRFGESNGYVALEDFMSMQVTAIIHRPSPVLASSHAQRRSIPPDAVMWSLAYRSNPTADVRAEPYRSTGHAPKSGPGNLDSTRHLRCPRAPIRVAGSCGRYSATIGAGDAIQWPLPTSA
jgi:hypothetical protein